MRKEVKIGIFLVGAITILVFFLVQVGWIRLSPSYPLRATFDYVGGLDEGAPVRLCGVEVGEVNSVSIDGMKVQVLMEIDNAVRIPQETIATVNFLGLMGERYIELIPPASVTGYLQANSEIEGKSPLPTEQLLLHLQSQIERFLESISQFQLLIEKVGLVELSTIVKDTLIRFNQLLAGFNQFISSDNMTKIDQTLDNIADISSQLNTLIQQVSEPIKSVSGQAQLSLKNITELSQRLHLTIQQIQSVTEQIKNFTKNISDKSLLGVALSDKKLGERLANVVNSLDELVTDLKAHPWKLLHKKK